jgi:tetratricopeptide (TPR) repeat protein
LRKLARARASRILVSTRLYPAELQTVFGGPIPGSLAYFVAGLSDDDALDLWRAFGVKGSRDALLPLFNSFDKHPLLIQALASQVARYRPAPGDFDRWRTDHPDFNPFSLPLVGRKSHVLAFALRGLDDELGQVLHTVAAFRMPAAYDTLAALLTGDGKPFADEKALDAALIELEDRGLLGWDRRANRYDMHPIVRGVIWSGLDEEARQETYEALHGHFEWLPMIKDWEQVDRLEDLTPAIELYNTLIGLGRYDDAYAVFRDRLDYATLFRLSASRQRVELLEMLFPDGLVESLRLSQASQHAFTLNALALAYRYSGQPGRSVPMFRRQNDVQEQEENLKNLSIGLSNLADALFISGELREAEVALRRALHITREQGNRGWWGYHNDAYLTHITREQGNRFQEAGSLFLLGLTLAARGVADDSEVALERSLRLFVAQRHTQLKGVVNAYLAQRALWLDDPGTAGPLANRAWELAHVQRVERDFVRAARLQGAAALGLGDLAIAEERLHRALTRARAVNLVEEELAALAALAELRRQQEDLSAARELLEDAWEPAERGPYPLYHADALNVLAQIERDAVNHNAAVEAARQAYRLAWCDGPPFAYHWGLKKARAHLADLGASEPDDLPPYDEARYEPMPEVEIDPEDEFHAGEQGPEN